MQIYLQTSYAKRSHLISPKNIPCVYFLLHVIKARAVAVGNDGLGLGLEGFDIVHYSAAEECAAILQGGFVDDDLGSFGLDAFHYTLDGALAEIIAVALHGEAVDTDDAFFLFVGVEVALAVVVIVSGLAQHLVCNKVFTCAVALYNGAHHILGHVLVVGKQLLGVLGQAVASVAERGVVVVCADAGVEADTFDDGGGV